MKTKSIWLVTLFIMSVVGCKYDDGALWDKVNSLDERVASIEDKLKTMNNDISAISTIVNALQNKVYVESVEYSNDGYVIEFTDGTKATIKNGKDGVDGTDGADGKDGVNGKDGKDAPVIGVDVFEGKYYWTQTLEGTKSWLTDADGNKIPVTGADAVTPQLKIDSDGYWLVSYDAGTTFVQMLDEVGNPVKAVGKDGNDGTDGINGDSFFQSVKVENNTLILILTDGTEINIQLKMQGEENPFTIVMNIDDPEILMVQDNDENLIHYYGEKNQDGTAKSIKSIFVENAVTGNTVIDVDDFMRPTRIVTYTGVTYDLEWSSKTTGVINAHDPASNITICVSFDTQTNTGVAEAHLLSSTKTSVFQRERKTGYHITPLFSNYDFEQNIVTKSADENNQQCLVTFKKCDGYYDPSSIYLAVKSGRGNWLGELHYYEKISTGKYLFHIPSDKYPSINTEQIAEVVNDVFSVVGFISECLVATGGDYVLCSAVSAGLTILSEGAFAVAAPAFAAGCTAAIKGLAAASLINGLGITGVPAFGTDSPTPTLSNAAISFLKDANLLKRIYTDDIVLSPVVNGLAGGYPEVTMTSQDNSVTIPIISDGDPILQRFYLEPSEPVEGQDYNAYAVVHCMPLGAIVKMDIKGTDGYTDAETTVLSTSNAIIMLNVPGAEQGVRDVVNVWITDSQGNYLAGSTASLYFH